MSNFGGDPVTQLNLKTVLKKLYAVLRARCFIFVMRSPFLRLLLRDHAQTAVLSMEDRRRKSLIFTGMAVGVSE